MPLIILIAALAVCGIAATIVALRTDGYRAQPTDWSRAERPDRKTRAVRDSAKLLPTGACARTTTDRERPQH